MTGHEPMMVPVQPLTLAWREAHVRAAEAALAEAERAGVGHHYGQGMLWCAIAQGHAAIANVRATERPRVMYREGGAVRGSVVMDDPEHPWLTVEATARMAAEKLRTVAEAVAGEPEIADSHRYGMPDRPRRPGA